MAPTWKIMRSAETRVCLKSPCMAEETNQFEQEVVAQTFISLDWVLIPE
jgi:hypothetical protein